MGVAWVFETDKSAVSIERAIEGEGGVKGGIFTVDSTPFKPNDNVQGAINHVFILHHSRFPQSTFTIAPNEKQKHCPRAISDRGFDCILAKLSSGLVQDTAGKFEVSGHEYTLQDFIIRTGNASMGVISKGVIVEVEYAPSCVASQCGNFLQEFIAVFFPDHVADKPVVLQKAQPEPYSALDTMHQYLDIFQNMRKKT
ncbi:hypothetical protein WUBG_03887 [Wuchereria bancrofti]|uniref:Mediator of RNA polymerase II transcription subunit 20 n=1 Tax=Wuchereria bancrofti TaxID=6293 RepID=J9ESP0_WUCBA|nr:hypothetical protein WUBG_03887 [Wuchereria bancrofti]VDM10226.1 unnamed protein product [Wuchereria bancrofti]